jgi:hypothetical protein
MKRSTFVFVTVILFLASALAAPAQDKKKPDPKNTPKVVVVLPLAAAPGTTSKLTVRGLFLEDAKEIRFADPQITAKIVSKGKANVPDKNPDKVGDTQVVVEVTLPAGLPAEPVEFTVVTGTGESKPHKLIVEGKVPVVAEKEPNDGFQQAQPIKVPQVVTGVIERAMDVDVFRFEGKKGQKIRCEVVAARYGSALDSMLTLYDADGQQIASNDDGPDGFGLDSLLEVMLPRDGVYYLSLIDAHDSGGPTHVYRLLFSTQGQENEAEKLFRMVEKKITSAKSLKIVVEIEGVFGGFLKGLNFKITLWMTEAGKFLVHNDDEVMFVSDGRTLVWTKETTAFRVRPTLPQNFVRALSTGSCLFALAHLSNAIGQTSTLTGPLVVSDFELGNKEKIGKRDAQAIHFAVKEKDGKPDDAKKLTLWIDCDAQLPLMLVMMEGKRRIVETYTEWQLDPKIDPKLFELPK